MGIITASMTRRSKSRLHMFTDPYYLMWRPRYTYIFCVCSATKRSMFCLYSTCIAYQPMHSLENTHTNAYGINNILHAIVKGRTNPLCFMPCLEQNNVRRGGFYFYFIFPRNLHIVCVCGSVSICASIENVLRVCWKLGQHDYKTDCIFSMIFTMDLHSKCEVVSTNYNIIIY